MNRASPYLTSQIIYRFAFRREPLEVLLLVRLDALAAVDAETGVFPAAEHPCAFGRQKPFVEKEGDGAGAEQLFQRLDSGSRQDVKPAAAHEKTVGDNRMEMRMEIEVFPEGVDGHHRAENTLGQLQYHALVVNQAVAGDAAELLEQNAVMAKIWAKHLGDAERVVAVRNRIED